MLVVKLPGEADVPSPVHGVPGLGSSNQEAVEEDREGLQVAAPEGTGQVDVGGGGYRGRARVPGRHESGL